MSWWGWVVIGAILLGAELSYVNAEFYFVFIGGSALITGVVAALVPALVPWMQWALFGFLVIVSMMGFRRRVRDLIHRPPADAVQTGPAADGTVTLPVGLAPGETCQAEHGGSFWTIRNGGPVALQAGSQVRIDSVEGLTLVVRRAA